MKVLIQNTSNSYFMKHIPSGKDVTDNRTEQMKDNSPPTSPVSQTNTPSIISSPTIASTSISMSSNDFSREENRLKTYDASWPHTFISPRVLAKTGFYYIGPHDKVKCYFCKLEVSSWEEGDNEVGEHSRWSQNCPLLKRRETANVPLEPVAELDQLLPPRTLDVCGMYSGIERRPGAYVETQPTEDIVENNVPNSPTFDAQTLKQPDFPDFAIETARLRSFDEWPKTMKQKPKQLSDAGFFYTQKGDRVMCFSCGGGLRDWDEEDDPWEQHALWYSKCDYLRLVKGQEYIDAIKAKHTQESVALSCGGSSSSSSSSTSSTPVNSQSCGGDKDEQNPDNKLCESRLCKICYSSEYNTAFFPCGHVIACTKCASSVTKCPLCRKPFEKVMRVFFS